VGHRVLRPLGDDLAGRDGAGDRAHRLGSAIAYAFGRTPVVLAAEARDLDELCGGRLILGLGTGTRRMQQDWHGLDGEHPASRMEELVPLLRRLWRLHEGPIEHDGRFYRLHVRPTAGVASPLRTEIPVYMPASNPRMIEAAGRVGDGLVGHPLFTPEYVREVARPALARGAEHTGRPTDVPIAGYLTCSVGADREAARDAARAVVAFNSTVKTYRVVHRLHGFEEHAERIRERWMAGDFAARCARCPTRCSTRSRWPARPTRCESASPSAGRASTSTRCCGRRPSAAWTRSTR